MEPTFYTIATAPFFPGLAALVNSLRLSGNDGPIVVLDRGLTADQRTRLEPHVRLVELSVERFAHPMVFKPFPRLLDPEGVLAFVDADMAVVRPLEGIVRLAEGGSICLFADHRAHRGRFFPEWHDLLGLKAPLRRRTYLNAGFLCFSAARHPGFLERWWQLCERIPAEQVFSDPSRPFWAGDQDVLNALLASEIDAGAVEELPEHEEAYPDDAVRVRVEDAGTLASTLDGRPVTILHHSLGPKVWDRSGWLRLRRDAYVRLLPRLLFAPDVPLRLDPSEVPAWLRPGRRGAALRTALDTGHRALRGGVHALPGPVERRLVAARDRLVRRVG